LDAARCALAVTAVVDAVVALLPEGHDAVTADRRAVAATRAEAAQGQLEGRPVDLALRVEDADLVDLAVGEAELRGSRGVERHAAALRNVRAAEVDDE